MVFGSSVGLISGRGAVAELLGSTDCAPEGQQKHQHLHLQ